MNRLGTVVGMGLFCFCTLFASAPIGAQPADVENISTKQIATIPPSKWESKVLPQDPTAQKIIITQHFGNPGTENTFYFFLNQNGYKPLFNQSIVAQSPFCDPLVQG